MEPGANLAGSMQTCAALVRSAHVQLCVGCSPDTESSWVLLSTVSIKHTHHSCYLLHPLPEAGGAKCFCTCIFAHGLLENYTHLKCFQGRGRQIFVLLQGIFPQCFVSDLNYPINIYLRILWFLFKHMFKDSSFSQRNNTPEFL